MTKKNNGLESIGKEVVLNEARSESEGSAPRGLIFVQNSVEKPLVKALRLNDSKREKIYVKTISNQVYDGFTDNLKKTLTHLEFTFKPKFAKRMYSKYILDKARPKMTLKGKRTYEKLIVKIPLDSIQNSTHVFKWNAQCSCGFKAKNQKGLKIHKRTCTHGIKPIVEKVVVKYEHKPITPKLVKSVNPKRKAKKLGKKPNTIEMNTRIQSFEGKNKLNNVKPKTLKQAKNKYMNYIKIN